MPESTNDILEVFENYFYAVENRVAEGICPLLHEPSIFDYLGHFGFQVSMYLAIVSLIEMK